MGKVGSLKRIKVDVTQADAYKYYKKNIDKKLQVDRKEYILIVNMFFKKFMEKIIYSADELKLPLSMGTLRVKKLEFDPERELKLLEGRCALNRIDWQETNKIGKIVPYTNDHSNYNSYKFYWSRRGSRIENKGIYSFKPVRQHKRALAKAIKELKKDYFK